MRPDFRTVLPALQLLMPLLRFADAPVHAFVLRAGIETPHFALPWLLTWFAHNVADFGALCRLYDACVASHPLLPLYLGAALLASRRDELLLRCECEYGAAHSLLGRLPAGVRGAADADALVGAALALLRRLPPEQLVRRAAREEGYIAGLLPGELAAVGVCEEEEAAAAAAAVAGGGFGGGGGRLEWLVQPWEWVEGHGAWQHWAASVRYEAAATVAERPLVAAAVAAAAGLVLLGMGWLMSQINVEQWYMV
jgi:hypothetical protein